MHVHTLLQHGFPFPFPFSPALAACKWSNLIFSRTLAAGIHSREWLELRGGGGGGTPNGLPSAGQVLLINRYVQRQSGLNREKRSGNSILF